jgi:hypothetical protein
MKKRSNFSVNWKSESGSDFGSLEVKPRSRPDSYGFQTGLGEDLTEALTMILLPGELVSQEEDELKLMAPAFKIVSLTNVYAQQSNLGYLA